MNATRRVSVAAVVALCLAFIMAPGARSGAWSHETKVTFRSPVQLPGLVLPAGEYRFQLLETLSSRHVVQVFNSDHSRALGIFNTAPVYRLEPTSKTIFVMEERPLGEPEAIKEWYYPGEIVGDEFLYSKGDRTMTTQAEPVAVEPIAPVTPEAVSPEPVQEEVTPAEPAAPVATEPVPEAAAPASAQPEEVQEPQAEIPAEELPKTASNMPLFAFMGSFLLLFGSALRRIAKI